MYSLYHMSILEGIYPSSTILTEQRNFVKKKIVGNQ